MQSNERAEEYERPYLDCIEDAEGEESTEMECCVEGQQTDRDASDAEQNEEYLVANSDQESGPMAMDLEMQGCCTSDSRGMREWLCSIGCSAEAPAFSKVRLKLLSFERCQA